MGSRARVERVARGVGLCYDSSPSGVDVSGDITGERAAVEYLEEFRRRTGRPLRVLHFRNVANNAYNNAKLLNRAGADCDVLCFDYYHVMGCPEWEDADFEGPVPGGDFDPDWSKVDLGAFSRPRWFVQGPLATCFAYLFARREGRGLSALGWWWALRLQGTARRRFFYTGGIAFLRRVAPWSLGLVLALGVAFGVADLRSVGWSFVALCVAVLLHHTLFAARVVLRGAGPAVGVPFADRSAWVVNEFARRFTDRKDALTTGELEAWAPQIDDWRRLFAHYDVIHAYAADGILPLLVGVPYVCFEHGTVRDIPREASPLGRSTAISYPLADVVYMTNADSLEAAKALRGGSSASIVCGVHGVDLERLRRRVEAGLDLPRLSCRFGHGQDVKVFFAPARQHWRDGFPTWLKGNDRMVRAAALVKARQPSRPFRLVFAEWGKEVALTKALVAELGVEDVVQWVAPLNKRALLAAYRCVDAVIDQFVLPCIGSVTIEALAVGAPVITALDDGVMREFYGETIPLFNCRTADEIADALERVLLDPAEVARRVDACKAWMAAHHSTAFQLASNVGAYRALLEGPARPARP
jgi:glycosyltransferase involved in cell wall biosynthesis